MATPFKYDIVYDAPIDAVASMLMDPAFRERVCLSLRAISHQVTIDSDSSDRLVRIEMEQPTDGVPAFAAKIVGSSTQVVQEERWTSPTTGEISVSIPGKPGEMVGTAILTEKDGVTTEAVEMHIRVRLPLVSGKIEALLAKLLGSALKAEQAVGREYLADQPR